MKKILGENKRKIKEEKGAASTLVLFTILIFVTILGGSYFVVTSLQKSQLKSDLRIQEIYRQDVDNVDYIYEEIAKYTATYNCIGKEQIFEVPYTGIYQIECWGAQGGDIDEFKGGKGAYTKGEISLTKGNKLYIYVGGQGTNTDVGGYNGGGFLLKYERANGSSGGGATDIRLKGGEWNNDDGLKSRIMVAAGGGGANNRNRSDSHYMYGAGEGGAGGGLTGESGTSKNYSASGNIPSYNKHGIGTGGTQTEGGYRIFYKPDETTSDPSGSFGNANYSEYQSGGGSGYYGGGSSAHGGAGGGSSFISGHSGCNAIDSSGTHTGQANHFSGYVFSNTQMIAGSEEMPRKDGDGTMVGNSGDGFVKISRIIKN